MLELILKLYKLYYKFLHIIFSISNIQSLNYLYIKLNY